MQTITTTSILPTLPAPKPWTSYLTLDLLLHLLQRSLLHPFICFLIPLCLLALHHPASSPSIRYTFSWACVVTLYQGLAIWNHRLAYGGARRVGLEGEVVLVAGGGGVGGGGLGRLLVEVFAMRGVRGVVGVDLRVPKSRENGGGGEREEWEERGVRWVEGDVSKREEVERVREVVFKEFGVHPTIIINCVAAPIASSTITSLTTPQFADTLTTNVTAHFNLLSVFLPAILFAAEKSPQGSTGGTIVSVSSILSHFSPAHLAAYSASKAALSSLHYTLTAEIRNRRLSHKVKTILVEPGQIDTALFAGVETPSRFFAPVLDTREVCKAITGLVDAGEGGVVRLPSYAAWVAWYGVLPVAVQRILRWVSGLDVAMKKAGKSRSDMVREEGADIVVGGKKEDKKDEENTNSGDDLVVVKKL